MFMRQCRLISYFRVLAATLPGAATKSYAAVPISKKCDGADQIVYAAVPISKKCGGADQMCECQPLVFELRLGFGHQAGLQDGGACFEGARWSRSIGHRGGADQFVNVAWVTAAVPISKECAGAELIRARG